MRKKYYIFLVLLIFIIFAFLFFPKGDKKIKHIFLITIDTLRADHLSCYGYPVKTTPFIDSLAEKGVLFENAYSQSATTCPSHASIMTGLYPSQHRVVANGYILDDSYITLAEILKENGFKTAAFTSTDRHFLASNINQGFDMYEEPLNTTKTYGYKYRHARLTINNAILWLDNFNPKNRLFMWIHLFDPHLPYHPPVEYKKVIKEQLSKEYLKNYVKKAKVNLEIFDNSFENYYNHILNYDSEIRYVDEELKRFFKLAENKGLLKDSLIIITADHGEALGQHNWLKHATFLYKEFIHIPLIFYFSNNKVVKRKSIKTPVGNFNIFYTVLDLLNINTKINKAIFSLSLKNLIKGLKDNENTIVISEREKYKKKKVFKKNTPFWRQVWEKGEAISILDSKYHYIYKSKLPDELFDLKKDYFETENIIKNHRKNILKYRKIIFKLKKENKKYNRVREKRTDKKVLKRLRSLGYVN